MHMHAPTHSHTHARTHVHDVPPHAHCSLAFSTLMLILGGLTCAISGLYTLEVMARGDGLLSAKFGERPQNAISNRKVDFAQLSELFGGKIMRSVTQVCTRCGP